jgi:hypothetical protein
MEKFCKKKSPKKFSPKFSKKNKFRQNFVTFLFKFFWAIGVPQPIWGMPAKI